MHLSACLSAVPAFPSCIYWCFQAQSGPFCSSRPLSTRFLPPIFRTSCSASCTPPVGAPPAVSAVPLSGALPGCAPAAQPGEPNEICRLPHRTRISWLLPTIALSCHHPSAICALRPPPPHPPSLLRPPAHLPTAPSFLSAASPMFAPAPAGSEPLLPARHHPPVPKPPRLCVATPTCAAPERRPHSIFQCTAPFFLMPRPFP